MRWPSNIRPHVRAEGAYGCSVGLDTERGVVAALIVRLGNRMAVVRVVSTVEASYVYDGLASGMVPDSTPKRAMVAPMQSVAGRPFEARPVAGSVRPGPFRAAMASMPIRRAGPPERAGGGPDFLVIYHNLWRACLCLPSATPFWYSSAPAGEVHRYAPRHSTPIQCPKRESWPFQHRPSRTGLHRRLFHADTQSILLEKWGRPPLPTRPGPASGATAHRQRLT